MINTLEFQANRNVNTTDTALFIPLWEFAHFEVEYCVKDNVRR